MTAISIVIGALGKCTEKLGNKRTSGDYLDYSILMIGKNTEKNPGNLRRLAITQTPVETHQLTLVWKTLKREKYWEFEIQTDHLISARRSDLVIVNKKKKEREPDE